METLKHNIVVAYKLDRYTLQKRRIWYRCDRHLGTGLVVWAQWGMARKNYTSVRWHHPDFNFWATFAPAAQVGLQVSRPVQSLLLIWRNIPMTFPAVTFRWLKIPQLGHSTFRGTSKLCSSYSPSSIHVTATNHMRHSHTNVEISMSNVLIELAL